MLGAGRVFVEMVLLLATVVLLARSMLDKMLVPALALFTVAVMIVFAMLGDDD